MINESLRIIAQTHEPCTQSVLAWNLALVYSWTSSVTASHFIAAGSFIQYIYNEQVLVGSRDIPGNSWDQL